MSDAERHALDAAKRLVQAWKSEKSTRRSMVEAEAALAEAVSRLPAVTT